MERMRLKVEDNLAAQIEAMLATRKVRTIGDETNTTRENSRG